MVSPLLSFIVPCHNTEHYVNLTISSIKECYYSNWECIIVDDASTDNSLMAIQKEIEGDSRFRLIRLEKNMGVGYARNKALSEARGKYLLPIDSDDMVSRDYPLKGISFLETNPTFSLYYGNIVNIDTRGRKIRLSPRRYIDYQHLLKAPYIHVSAITLTERVREIGGWDENIRGYEDYEFYIRYLTPHSNVMYTEETAIFCHERPNSRQHTAFGIKDELFAEIREKNKVIYDKELKI